MSLVKILILPPGILVLLLIAGSLWAAKSHRVGRIVLAGSIALFWALSSPLVGGTLLTAVSLDAPEPAGKTGSTAIVVLGGEFDATGDGGHPGALTLERLARAAALHRKRDLPILVTAGQLKHLTEPGAVIMAQSLREMFGVQARWKETASTDTHENAMGAARILQEAGIDHALVVTHRWHLRRAMLAFESTGLDVTPVALHAMAPASALKWRDLLPTLSGFEASYYALYEIYGYMWYKIRH